ncbi:carbohydrate kinase fggy [Plasmopara halstedii]|uniref:Carbohydrate kinase fggy n=1 Tax=Plasmopara halstedii TaxID=4781 RepID=A0A0P1B6L7_PLAHL|nr:carbohydrate kinase fggy [Plasmopara halstedii]CEG50126.1 carbohydrate kinase fggy [Plasmopara halstedii]|eukprot:XP_024586495.1 carbohydrate kinase fggy [Plasmopara halstedii]
MKLFLPLFVASSATCAWLYYNRQKRRSYLYGLAQPHRYRGLPVAVVIDIGSSSIRASCFALVSDAEWVLINGSLHQQHVNSIDFNGEADIKKIAAFTEQILDRVMNFLRVMDLTHTIVGVGFSTFAMNMLGVDVQGDAITPVYTYAGRRKSTAKWSKVLQERLAAREELEEAHNRTGTVIHPAYAPATFLRLYEEEPAVVERVAKWQSISGFLIGKWTSAAQQDGCVPISFSEASWMGLLDFRRSQWDASLLELVYMDINKMPTVVDSTVPFSGLNSTFAKRWPELRNVPFFLGVSDGAAANVGSKCTNASRIAVTIGTSAAIRVVLSADTMAHAKVPKGLWCYRIGRDHVLLGGALSDGGSIYKFFRDSFRLSDEDVASHLEKLVPTKHGLTILPFLSGERAPGWLENATCAISGISKWTTPYEILFAGMESIALRIGILFSLLAFSADFDATVVVSGTALTSSSVWCQMIADCLGKKVILETRAIETTSRGIAMLMGTFLGLHTLTESGSFPNDTNCLKILQPDSAAHAAYLKARYEQEQFYRKMYSEM